MCVLYRFVTLRQPVSTYKYSCDWDLVCWCLCTDALKDHEENHMDKICFRETKASGAPIDKLPFSSASSWKGFSSPLLACCVWQEGITPKQHILLHKPLTSLELQGFLSAVCSCWSDAHRQSESGFWSIMAHLDLHRLSHLETCNLFPWLWMERRESKGRRKKRWACETKEKTSLF